MAEEYYNSKYYSCEEIDKRLLQGTYDDAVAAGYTGSKEEFDELLGNLPQTLKGKQDSLTFDESPQEESKNPVTSGGIYTSLKDIKDLINQAVSNVSYIECNTPSENPEKLISIPNFKTLSTNILFLVKMVNENLSDSSSSLNINSLGAKPLYYNDILSSKENTWEPGEVVKIYYDGVNFYASNVQGGKGEGGNKIVEWDTNAATTRKSVKSIDRKAGMQISYIHPYDGWINEQYIGEDVDDENWVLDENWQRMSTDKDLTSLKEEMPKEHVDVEEDGFYLIDKNGNIGFGIKPDGTVLGGGGGSSIDLVKVDEFND